MNRISLAALALAVTATIAAAPLADNDKDAQVLDQISGYRQWAKVNEAPVKVAIPLSLPVDMALG